MLQIQTVKPALLRILRQLTELPGFEQLRLVGRTSLALQIGHRESVDIDLFGPVDFQFENFSDFFAKIGNTSILKKSKNINVFSIDGIKVGIVNYSYPWIADSIVEGDLKLASVEDIGAMKLNAITGRGAKKDFIDLYFLLQKFSLQDLFHFYQQKYSDGNVFLVRKSLTYFLDADREEMPKMFSPVTWPEMKKFLLINFKTEGI